MINEIFTVLAPVFIISGLGYVWFRFGRPFDTATVGGLVMNFGAPCLVFSSLTRMDLDPNAFAQAAGVSLLALTCFLTIGALGLKAASLPIRTYLPTLVHPNTGNMGLPLCLMAFGETGLALGVAYYFVNSISQYTLGLSLASGRFSVRQLLTQPVVWAVAAALLVRVTEATLPAFVTGTTTLLAGFVIPAMLLMLGTSLARLTLSNLRTTCTIALLRLGAGFGFGIAAIWAFDLEGIISGVVLIQCSMPAAVFNIVFAEEFDNDPASVAAVILISTLVSFATLPLLVGYALDVAGG